MCLLKRKINKKNKLAQVLIGALLIVVMMIDCRSLPQYNIQDTQPFYTVKGTDKYYSSLESSCIQLHLSPYHQHAKSGRNAMGTKVAVGDIYGKWNMFGVFFGDGGRPAGTTIPVNYSDVNNSKTEIQYLSLPDASVPTPPGAANIAGKYQRVPDGNGGFVDFTNEEQFNPERDIVGSYDSVMVRYERFGVRAQLNFNFKFGLGLGMRTGVADYKQKAEFNLSNEFRKDSGLSYFGLKEDGVTIDFSKPMPPLTETSDPALDKSARHILRNLMDDKSRNAIAKDFSLDLNEVRQAKWEDSHFYLNWQHPFEIADREGDFACSIIPYFSVGIWLPTGEERNQDQAFSMPTGNDGFTMVSLETALSFDFPKMIQASFGGGALISNERELSNQRVPTSQYQAGIIPWKTNIRKHPGVTWYLNASFKAEDFLSTLSFYFDWLYTRHLKDSITLRETDENRKKIFAVGASMLERDSEWKNQQVNFGFSYRVTPLLAFGFGLQSYISGVRVYRTTTVMGTIDLTF